MARKKNQTDIATLQFGQGCDILRQHPIFAPLLYHANINRQSGNQCSLQGWAVVTSNGVIHVHPTRRGSPEEWVYVLAHCLLHLGFGHFQKRTYPREWNAACNYFIAKFLADLKNLSAESIYDQIVKDLRLYRKLSTLRGIGQCDILEPGISDWWTYGDGVGLDEFYRRCLSQGLAYHHEQNRGFLPAGLIEEIRALSYPPIPWDVELAKWFDNYFSPLIKVRSYARLSRRQSATPEIPRPRYVPDSNVEEGRTFGVVLDTSGSMERELLGKALGAISSYSISHDVSFVRVVFCDAFAYDQGYITPESLADRVQVKGRGGTVLQPGIDLLERAEDFPKNGPLLIITDGDCDRVHIRREHAFLIPVGRHLPFIPKGQVLRIK
jgi:hypothetical protein